MTDRSRLFLRAPLRGAVRRDGHVRWCGYIFSLALVLSWSTAVVAADMDSASSTASPSAGGGDGQPDAGGVYGDAGPAVVERYPVPVDETGVAATTDYLLSGPGTDHPLGFASSFAPTSCLYGAGQEYVAASAGSTGRLVQVSVAGSETYSDNINLDERNEESDFITALALGLGACSSTGRIRGQLEYRLQGVMYAHHSNYNDVYNDILGSTAIELIANHLYLDANTEYGQAVIDPSVGYSRSNIIRPDTNKTTAWTSNISPYLVQSLGPLGTGIARYRYGRAIYDDDSVADVTVHGVSATLTSPATADPYSWQAQVASQTVEQSGGDAQRFADRYLDGRLPPGYRDDEDTRHFDSATLMLGYRVTPYLTLTALGGVENEYHDNGEVDRWAAPRWQVGARWANSVNSLEIGYGHRFYGASYSLAATHKGRLVDLSMSYDEGPSSPALDVLNNVGSGSMFGSLGNHGYGGFGTRDSLLDRGVYVRKLWRANMAVDTSRTRTEITGFVRENDYQLASVPDSRSHGVALDNRYDLGPRTRVVTFASWENYDEGFASGDSSDNYIAGTSLVRDISPSAEGSIAYAHTWRNGNSDYHENRVVLQVRKVF